ncbi:MAG TPA: phosphotransferase family protein [Acidimicrobiales bacterium]|nr:phosphotransferase family protein [Acidimicrobiales bacterium]
MAARPTADEVAEVLGRQLGGTVHDLRRLSGGASRITSSFDLHAGAGDGAGDRVQSLILQQDRGDGMTQGAKVRVEAALLRAAHQAGVPVPEVVAVGGERDGLDPGWLVVERLEGETIPRKLLRDPEWAAARVALTAQCGQALAAIHTIDPGSIEGLPGRDPLRDPLPFLDALGEVRPALELGVRWLDVHRPPAGRRVTVHGDFRTGNLLVGPQGLRAVLDWELAHGGEAAEDIGWLCAPAWRFGGEGTVGGFGSLDELLVAYAAAGGETLDPDVVRWWEVYATVKWATICALQASAHLSGATRSVELAAIGRRVCESEWDLFVLLGVAPADGPAPGDGPGAVTADDAGGADVLSPFGRPTAAELVEAVREYLERSVMEKSEGGMRFEARIARNALATVERQLQLGPALAAAHAERLTQLGFADDASLAATIRTGDFGDRWQEVAATLAASARDQLLVANPSYLPTEYQG